MTRSIEHNFIFPIYETLMLNKKQHVTGSILGLKMGNEVEGKLHSCRIPSKLPVCTSVKIEVRSMGLVHLFC